MRAKKVKPPLKLLPAPSLLHSGVRIAVLSTWLRFKRFATPLHLLVIAVVVYFVLATAFTAAFFLPHSVKFSYASSNCFTSPVLLPNLVAKKQGKTFTATPVKSIAIGGYPIYSHTTCVTPAQTPENKVAESISYSPLNIGFLKKRIRVTATALPVVNYSTVLATPIPTNDPLVFRLDRGDRFFEYRLVANNKIAPCDRRQESLVCDVPKLGLDQSASYSLTMQRVFKGKSYKTVFEQTVATVGSVQLVGSSVVPGQIVYDAPMQITLNLNKEIKSFDGLALSLVAGQDRQKISATAKAEGQTIVVNFRDQLARDSSFELTVKNIIAADGGHLPSPLTLPFTTSGGPKVKGVSIGSYKVSPSANIVITFDSSIFSAQALSDFVKLEIGGNTVAATITANGNRVTVNPASDIPKCANFTVRVLDGIKNEAGITGGSAWSYRSRALCQTVFSIGASVQGRAITAYRFGAGGSYTVFVGGTHGDEKSSTLSLNSLVDYLESHYDQIPANRTIVLIPNLNPDGYTANRRTNANNVDLNRNFPANNWKQGVTMPDGTFNSNGGGSTPLSEPESSSLASYVLAVNPRLVLTYHAAAGVVIPNDSGDSVSLAQTYDQKSNLNFASNAQTGTIFNYDTTGAFEDWLHDKHDITTLLIELWTKSSNEFTKNQNAMWYMVALP